jgi:hypothetical protein
VPLSKSAGRPPGSIGKYEVVRELGRGGMGIVLEVKEPGTGPLLALKLLDPRASGSEDVLRFHREAELLARVRHMNVVRIHDVGRTAAGPYLVCEKVVGRSLAELVAEGPLPPREAARIARGLADGLTACHAAGIIHRDLKPANVVVRDDGSPVLLDFGVARDQQTASLTQTGALLGTPNYMAPEQADGRRVDHRADLYGLGAILFACLTGRPPFEASGPVTSVLARVLLREASWPTTPRVPPDLQRLVRRAMARDPDARHPDAMALRDDLDRWLSGVDARRSVLLKPLFVGALVVAILGGVGALVHLRAAPDESTPTTTSEEQPAPEEPEPEPEAARRAERAALWPGERLPLQVPEMGRVGASGAPTVRATFLDDGSIVAALSDGTLLRWPTVGSRPDPIAVPSGVAFTAIVPLGRGRACVGTASGALFVVGPGLTPLVPIATPWTEAPDAPRAWSLAYDPGDALLAVSLGTPEKARHPRGRVFVARLVEDRLVEPRLLEGVSRPSQGMAFSDDGELLAVTYGEGRLETEAGVHVERVRGRAKKPSRSVMSTPRCVAFRAGGHVLAVGCTNGSIVAFDLDAELDADGAGGPLVTDPAFAEQLQAHAEGVNAVVLRGRRAVSSSFEQRSDVEGRRTAIGDVRIWDLDAPRLPRRTLQRSGVRALSLSPDGELLLLSGDRALLEVWALDPLEPR